jgi:hypothetical protein
MRLLYADPEGAYEIFAEVNKLELPDLELFRPVLPKAGKDWVIMFYDFGPTIKLFTTKELKTYANSDSISETFQQALCDLLKYRGEVLVVYGLGVDVVVLRTDVYKRLVLPLMI